LIPGFEIIFLFAAIIVYIFYNKYIKWFLKIINHQITFNKCKTYR
jgi:hypothetical protein